ncbi:hypothetical protein [Bradyrhizobium liaoningense]
MSDGQPFLQIRPKPKYRRLRRVQLKKHPNRALDGMALKDVQHIMTGAFQECFQPFERRSGKRTNRVYLVNVCEGCSHPVGPAHEQGMIWSTLDENLAGGD